MKSGFKHDVQRPFFFKIHSTNPDVIFFRALPEPQPAPQDCGQKSLRGTLCLQIIMIIGD